MVSSAPRTGRVRNRELREEERNVDQCENIQFDYLDIAGSDSDTRYVFRYHCSTTQGFGQSTEFHHLRRKRVLLNESTCGTLGV
jgi:hypothetical protein